MGEPERSRGQDHSDAGRPHAAPYKPEPAVDLDTAAIVAAETQPADRGDTTTLGDTLEEQRE